MSAPIPDDAARALALADAVDAQRDRILDVTRFVNRHPELAHEEFECSRHIAGALATALDVETTLTGMATGFRATLAGASPGLTVALVAVYDAVGMPDGDGTLRAVHSCGHGPVSGAVVGAALALASLRESFAGTLAVRGARPTSSFPRWRSAAGAARPSPSNAAAGPGSTTRSTPIRSRSRVFGGVPAGCSSSR